MRTLGKKAFRPQPVMNVTPLVDVVLVLLIIFMLVIPAMMKFARVELPGIINVDPKARGKADPYTLSITADGAMFFETTRVPAEQFIAVMREARERAPRRRLLLRADRDARYGDVRLLFKNCQELGFPGVSLKVNERKADAEVR